MFSTSLSDVTVLHPAPPMLQFNLPFTTDRTIHSALTSPIPAVPFCYLSCPSVASFTHDAASQSPFLVLIYHRIRNFVCLLLHDSHSLVISCLSMLYSDMSLHSSSRASKFPLHIIRVALNLWTFVRGDRIHWRYTVVFRECHVAHLSREVINRT